MKRLIRIFPFALLCTNIFFFVIALSFIIVAPRFAHAEIPIQDSDAQALGVVVTIDQNEIQMAQLATQKNIDPKVMDYAKMLNREHSQHLTQTRELAQNLGITIVDNTAPIKQLSTQCEQDISALTHLDGEAFAQLYIADMIKGHAEALTWIERQGTQNDQIKNFLRETRKHINMHLKKAQVIHEHQTKGQT